MARIGFVGPSYQSESLRADAQMSLNWYAETVESGQGKSQMALYRRGGLRTFTQLPGEQSVPQMFAQNGRAFAAGLNFWEIFPDGSKINRGPLNGVLNGPVFMTANQNQVLACSNGNLYLYDLTANTVTPVAMGQFNGPIASVGFSDGFFIAVQQNSQNFYLSDLLDGATWSGLNASQVSEFTDNIVAMGVSHRELWLLGSKASLPHFNSGALFSPFVPISGAFVEQGCAAVAGAANLDNALFWLGQNQDGRLVMWRSNPYTPARVSTHAVETAWANYPVSSDAVMFTMQDRGHSFLLVYFPSASATWVYDASTGYWYQWDYADPIRGSQAFRARCHCLAFNQAPKHLVGDWASGTVYEYSKAFYDDFGTTINRVRRAPHVSVENEWAQHKKLTLDLETGIGTMPPLQGNRPPTTVTLADPTGALWSLQVDDFGMPIVSQGSVYGATPTVQLTSQDGLATWTLGVDAAGMLTTTAAALAPGGPNQYMFVTTSGRLLWQLQVDAAGNLETVSFGYVTRGPKIYLRWSDDGGHTWSNYHEKDAGEAGQYRVRVVWRRLGRSRDRVYEVSCSDPVAWAIVDAYLDAQPGYQPVERLSRQMGKMA